MHDYQLERLNTRSFEQLVQALGLEIIGKQLEVFGDGPDGGREATFQGVAKYPEGKEPWNGYGVMQAKFRQKPDSLAKKNADWAITQLKAEFSKLKPRLKSQKNFEGNKRCPEYYIFATNLTLSAVAEKGGKDRVRRLLDNYKKSHGLKDYAIWDGDQIRRFLDGSPNIRATYAAWLLPSDVLTAMMEFLKLEQTDFLSTIRRYLEVELLDDQYAKLGQGGYTDSNAIPLSNVFVDLPVEMSPIAQPGDKKAQRPTFLKLFFEEGRQVLKPSANVQRTSLFRQHTRAGRVVLIGGPGQGKTTVGQFACQLLRAALLQSTPANYSPEVTQALSRITKQTQGLEKSKVLRYPLRVDLKRLAEALAGEGDLATTSLLDFLVRHISKRTDSELNKTEFRRWLKGYPWLLVLDGLDEVPASSNRTKMMEAIRDFVGVEAHQQDADLLILATTRPQGYSDEFDPSFYQHLPLAALNADEALTYGVKLAEARHPGLQTRIEELKASLTRATTNPATVRLMESPLQVTIMLALIEGGGEPPEQRWKLFHDYYDVIYRREKERGTPFSAILGRYEPDFHWLHHRAGWVLQQRNAAVGTTAARLTHADFENLVDDRLQKRGHKDPDGRGALVKKIREAATDRLVFLVGNTAKEIGFEIRSLQEFMAAEHCFDGSENCIQETVKIIAPHPYWRNVFLFVAGRIFFEKESLNDTLIAVCERLNETLNDQAQGFIAAGSRLAIAMLKDGSARNQPENTRVLARCASQLLDAQDPKEATQLVEMFNNEAGEVWKEELSKRLAKDQSHFPHLAWNLCLELASAKINWAEQIIKSRFPWRHTDIRQFFHWTLSGGGVMPRFFVEKFQEHIFTHSPLIWNRLIREDTLAEALNFRPLKELRMIFRTSLGPNTTVLIDDAGKETCNGVRVGGVSSLSGWKALRLEFAGIKDVHPIWQLYQHISEFARDLTPASLAKQLPDLFEICKNDEFKSVRWFLPWQIYACLLARNSGVPADKILSAVTSGGLGSEADWQRWSMTDQARVKLSSLGYPQEPLSVTEEHQGLVYSNSGWNHGGGSPDQDNGEIVFAEALVKSLPSLKADSYIAKHLVNLCCFGLNQVTPSLPPNNEAIVRALIYYCCDEQIPMTREIIISVIKSSFSSEAKIELLGRIDSNIDKDSWLNNWKQEIKSARKSCESLISDANTNGSLIQILGALSYLPSGTLGGKLPASVLGQFAKQNEKHGKAAIALSISSLEWRLEESDHLADDVLTLVETYPPFLWELLDSIESQGAKGPHLEAFLLRLVKNPTTDFSVSLRSEIARLIVKLVERRPAVEALPNPSKLM